MNFEIDATDLNVIDHYFPDVDSNFLLEFDAFSSNYETLDLHDDTKLNESNLYSSILETNSQGVISSIKMLDHEYCLMSNVLDQNETNLMNETIEDHIEDINLMDVNLFDTTKEVISGFNDDKDLDALYSIHSFEQIEYNNNNSFEYSNVNFPDIHSIKANDYNVYINDDLIDSLNKFDGEDDYDSMSDQDNLTKNTFQKSSKKKYFLPMTINDLKQNRRTRFKEKCELVLSEEEKNLLLEYGCNLPTNVPLTREEERILKAVRRKIRNKYAAKMSRQKKQNYMEGLEKRVKLCTTQNQQLQFKVGNLEKQNSLLMNQLKHLQNLISKTNPLKGQSLENLGKLATNRHAQTGTCFMVLILSFSLFILPNLTKFFGTTQPDSQPLFGNSRKILQLNPPAVLLSVDSDEISTNNRHSSYFTDESDDSLIGESSIPDTKSVINQDGIGLTNYLESKSVINDERGFSNLESSNSTIKKFSISDTKLETRYDGASKYFTGGSSDSTADEILISKDVNLDVNASFQIVELSSNYDRMQPVAVDNRINLTASVSKKDL